MKTKSPISEYTLFAPREIQRLIEDAFISSCSPAWGGRPLSEERLGYVRNFAKILIERLEVQDIQTGHMNYTELVSMLIGAALTLQVLHGEDSSES